jgi:hypothetical protein
MPHDTIAAALMAHHGIVIKRRRSAIDLPRHRSNRAIFMLTRATIPQNSVVR